MKVNSKHLGTTNNSSLNLNESYETAVSKGCASSLNALTLYVNPS